MSKKVVIAGAGVSGLVFNQVLKSYKGVEATILEPGAVGGEFLAGGLKYIHQTDAMEKMLDGLNVLYSPYTVQGGILLRERVEPYPACFQGLDKVQALRIQQDHFRKTRRIEPGEFAKKAMNDPASTKPRKALKCNFEDMVKALARGANIVRAPLAKIEEKEVVLGNGSKLPFDYLVLTIPLWVIKRAAPWKVPDGLSIQLNTATVKPARDPYAKWDYVYTPYTPANSIHRFSPNGGGYSVEVNGELDMAKLGLDLDFIFKDGWSILDVKPGLKGHLLPLDEQPAWPDNVAPLGRFAQWDPRATTDETLANSQALADRWFGVQHAVA